MNHHKLELIRSIAEVLGDSLSEPYLTSEEIVELMLRNGWTHKEAWPGKHLKPEERTVDREFLESWQELEWSLPRSIEVLPLYSEDSQVVVRAEVPEQFEVASTYFRYFCKETNNLQGSYEIGSEDAGQQTYLVKPSIPNVLPYPCAGAFQVVTACEFPCLSWVWIHPHYRGKGLVSAVMESLREMFPDLVVDQPRPAVARAMEKAFPLDHQKRIVSLM